MVIINSYPQKNPLEVELSASRRGYKRYSEGRFLILKSLDSDNLLEKIKEKHESFGSSLSMGAHPIEGRRLSQDEELQSACS